MIIKAKSHPLKSHFQDEPFNIEIGLCMVGIWSPKYIFFLPFQKTFSLLSQYLKTKHTKKIKFWY